MKMTLPPESLRSSDEKSQPRQWIAAAIAAVAVAMVVPVVAAGNASAAVTGTTPTCIASSTDFANALLNAIPEPDTPQNVAAIVAWELAEGGNWRNAARFNPLNTTQKESGSSTINSVGVRAFTSWLQGMQATVTTIENGNYAGVLTALKAGNNATAVAQAVGSSKWGTPDFSKLIGTSYTPTNPSWQPACAAQTSTNKQAVQVVRNPAGPGYWLLSAQGGIYSYGGAPFFGSAAGQAYFAGQTAVALGASANGTGYWILSAAGGIYSYGTAGFYGSAAGQGYFAGQTATALAVDPAGTGYIILSAGGGTYSYNAPNFGSAAGQAYFAGQTATDLVFNKSGNGYYILSAGGGVYAYGGAQFYGSAAGQSYFAGNRAVSIAVDSADTGYWILSSSGGIYGYGSPAAPFYGGAAGQPYFAGLAAASLAPTADGGGYWILSTTAGVYSYGDAGYAGGGM